MYKKKNIVYFLIPIHNDENGTSKSATTVSVCVCLCGNGRVEHEEQGHFHIYVFTGRCNSKFHVGGGSKGRSNVKWHWLCVVAHINTLAWPLNQLINSLCCLKPHKPTVTKGPFTTVVIYHSPLQSALKVSLLIFYWQLHSKYDYCCIMQRNAVN